MHALVRYSWVSLLVLFPWLTHATCPDNHAVAAYVADVKAARVSQGFGNDLSELADLMLEGTPTGTALIATNIAFRGGALGPRVTVEPTQAFLEALATMTVVMTEDTRGQELGRVQGHVLMEHPIHAAMWLARALKKAGVALKPGYLLSLGGYIPPAPAQPGTSITVTYVGLPGDPAVTVHFE